MTRRTLLIYGASLLFVSLLAVLITSISMGGGDDDVPSDGGVVREAYRPEISDFPFLDDLLVQKRPNWYPLREPVEEWTGDMVQPYWIPMEDILLDHIQQENEKQIEDLLLSIP